MGRYHSSLRALVLVFATLFLGTVELEAANPNRNITERELSCPDPVSANGFLPIPRADLPFVLNLNHSDLDDTVRCACQASNEGKPKRGVRFTSEITLTDLDGNVLFSDVQSGKSRRDGSFAHELPFPSGEPGTITQDLRLSGKKRMNRLHCHCAVGTMSTCVPGNNTMCLGKDGRFQADAFFRDPFDGSNRSMVATSTGRDSGYFTFAPLDNTRLLVELADKCKEPSFNSFWLFAAATTDVSFTLTVTDTETGDSRVYENPLNNPFEQIRDTRAFATCP